jgi:hypothetical protein
MTSATTQPARGTGGYRAEGHGYGLVLFASVLLVIVGCFNLIYGIAAIANSHVFTANAHYVFGDLRTWGVRRGGARAQRHRPDVLHPRLPILVADHHRHGRGGAVGAVRLRQPPEHRNRRLMREAAIPAPVGRTHGA